MAAISSEVKAFIVQALACYENPAKVIELVKEEFKVTISRQQVSAYDPSNAMAKSLSKKWVDLFNTTRARFQNEISDIPIANKAYRLRTLDRMATSTEKMKNFALTAQLIEQAAKEVGDLCMRCVFPNGQQRIVRLRERRSHSLITGLRPL